MVRDETTDARHCCAALCRTAVSSLNDRNTMTTTAFVILVAALSVIADARPMEAGVQNPRWPQVRPQDSRSGQRDTNRPNGQRNRQQLGHRRRGFTLEPRPIPPGHKFIGEAVTDWYFRARQTRRIVVWTVHPFRNTKSGRHYEDASVSLKLAEKEGPVRCSIVRSSDETDLNRRKRRASVAASIAGTGSGALQLTVAPVNPFIAAGEYSTVVHVTVTAP